MDTIAEQAVAIDNKDRVICRCYNVKESELTEDIKRMELQTLCEVREKTCAGNGCNGCHYRIRQLLK